MSDDTVTRLNEALAGRYHVERQVGEGGMAAVYLAEDLRHHRRVALKVLRPELAAVVGGERFLAEVETTANLQHPHILPLYDSGEAGSFLFYVMPYVEGETLRQRLDRDRQLPVDEALGIATAVAGALDYAHRHGVVHRDVKPANILMQDGQAVVGDFGVALAVGTAGGSRLTETGITVGTPHYMSPEQATGERTVGPPSDVYALGAVLYEMLTGEPPYTAATAHALLAKIVQGAPVSARAARGSVPPNVDAAIRNALETLPADRFTEARQFAEALADPGFRHGAEAAGAPAGAGWKRLAVAASVLAGTLSVALLWSLTRPPPASPPPPVERFRLGIEPSGVPAILPDGSGVVYNGGGRLLLHRWANLESEPIPGTEGVGPNSTPVVSPSGDEVAYVRGETLEVASLTGGVGRTLADSADCCARWGGDGFVYYSSVARDIARVPATGGDAEVVIEREAGPLGDFQVLPGGEVAVFSNWSEPTRVEVVRLATRERKVLTPGAKPYVTPAGQLVFGSTEGQILAAPFDADAMELTGPARPLVEGVMVALDYPIYSLSENGALVYSASAAVNALQFGWVTRSGEVAPAEGAQFFHPSFSGLGWRLSPDGRRIAFGRRVNGNDDVWIAEVADGRTSRLTFGDAPDARPEWAPDGRSIAYRSGPPGERGLWSKAVDGTGEAELLFDGFDVAKGVWSPDGTWLLLERGGRDARDPARDILGIRPGVDTAAVPLAATADFEEVAPAVSRDGRWLAYGSNETGRDEIYVRPFPNVDDGTWQVSTEGGVQPVWAHNGRELFFIAPGTRELVAAEFSTDGDTFRPGRLTTLFTLPPLTATPFGVDASRWESYDVSLDDDRFLMAGAYQPEDARVSYVLVRNLLAGLEGRVPE